MKNIMNSIIVAFSEILRWSSIKIILLSGIFAFLIWGGIGYLLWDYLVAISSKVIDLIPFAMVRSNGAFLLSTFLWFQLVLISFAIIYAFGGNIILKSIPKEKYSSVTFITLLVLALLWAVIWFFVGDFIYNEFLTLLKWLPFETVEKGLSSLIALYVIYNAIIVTLLFIASIFSEEIVKHIEESYFGSSEVIKDNRFISIKYTIKDTLIFIILSILAFPLLFIPVVNILVQIALWVWLYKDTLSFDALSMTHKELDKTIIKEHRFAVYFISFITTLFNFVPLVNIIAPFFGEMAMYHYFKSIKESS